MVDMRNSLTKDVTAQLHEYFGDQVFNRTDTSQYTIGRGTQPWVASAPVRCAIGWRKTYLALAGELIGRLSQARPASERRRERL